ncbi:hypothetical protein [Providencia heimbachae]|uniref:O-antigen polymerase n=2 Tax=Morganellaceae TaxID=1903414 RepID=A0A1B7JXN7_9GAMM|nr:hypothetical protein [Providencia heimbachae]OAT52671.1 hypothetical protein M998_1533 [Providencia heimbachae ATCC 35613]SQH14827.1 Lipid A core - O-antigen ligase and related enzymes [Providencia heimbachae]
MKKITIRNEDYLLLVIFCSFISFNSLPINLIYILGFVLLLIGTLNLFLKPKIKNLTYVYFLFSTLFLISQYIGIFLSKLTYDNDINVLSPLLFYFSWLISIFIPNIIHTIPYKKRNSIYIKSINISIIFLSIELLSRTLLYESSRGFIYALKSSYFYFDSNFAGLVITSLIAFAIYLNKVLEVKVKKQIFLLFVLLLLTFSRAAIVAGIIIIIIYHSIVRFRLKSYFTLLATFFTFSYLLYQYLYLDINFRDLDGSFNSKFYIFSIAEDLYSSLPVDLKFFGIGMGNAESFLGIFAHNIYVTFFLEFGIIGSVVFLSFTAYSLYISKSYTIILWLPIFICGISLFSAYSPFIFIINAIIISEEREKQKGHNPSYE